MKIYIKLLVIASLCIVLSACNFPGVVISEVTPSQNKVATAVSKTLTANPLLPTELQSTLPPTSTATPQPVPPTLTPSQMPSPTPEDWKSTLGAPAWQSFLDNGKSFGLSAGGYEDENTRIVVKNGVMELSSISTIGFRSWRLTSPMPQNFYLEAVYKTVSCASSDQYGLVYRAPDYSSGLGYYFGLSCTGAYSLYKWSNSGASVVLQGTSPSINPGANQVNRVGIMAKGNTFTFYFNDKKVQEYTDSELSEPGHFGTFIGGYSGNFVVQMDEIAYWDLH